MEEEEGEEMVLKENEGKEMRTKIEIFTFELRAICM